MRYPKILLLGSNGMAGSEFIYQLKDENFEILTLARRNADIIIDCSQFKRVVEILDYHQPDIVINCCAIVDINLCEVEPYLTYKINVGLVEILSTWCNDNCKKFVHISTDHFYDYGGRVQHVETDPVVTLNHYSRQKLSSEHVALFSKNSLILRTSITGIKNLFEPKTFFDWAYSKCINREKAIIFTDAYTSTIDVATFVNYTIKLIKLDACGIFNIASSDVYSKAEFVVELSRQLNISTTNFEYGQVSNLEIRRANCLGLCVKKLGKFVSEPFPDLNHVVKNLLERTVNT